MKRLFFSLLFMMIAGSSYALSPAIQGALSVNSATCAASYGEDTFTRADNADVTASAPITWTETDTGGLLSILFNKVLFTHSATTAAYVNFDRGDGVSESWFQVKITFSQVTGLGNATLLTFVNLQNASTTTSLSLRVVTNAGGTISTLRASYNNDSNSSVNLDYAWSPNTDTEYTIKLHLKAGASSTGVVEVWIDGSQVISESTLAYDTYAVPDKVRIGNIGSTFTDTDGSLTVLFDDFEWRSDDCFN